MLPIILYCAIVIGTFGGLVFWLLGLPWIIGAILGAGAGALVGVLTAAMCTAASWNDAGEE